jgi:hypothetical protein
MNISLGTLKSGKWRNMTPKELSELNKRIRNSKKTTSVPYEADEEEE